MVALEDKCYCTGSTIDNPVQPGTEGCNGIDDDCNSNIDDVEFADTCGCAYLTNFTLIDELKGRGDSSCDGIDSNCNGMIDENARDCACATRSPQETLDIKGQVNEICDDIDNDCDGIVDENFADKLGKTCGYGLCAGGQYVCNVHGDEAVCNTTVRPEQTFEGIAVKMSSEETCDLRDNDCDASIDEDCACTPENAIKLPYSAPTGIAVSPDNRLAALLGGDELRILSTEDFSVFYHDTDEVWGGVFSADSRTFYGRGGQNAYVYKAELASPPVAQRKTFSSGHVVHVAPSADESQWYLYRSYSQCIKSFDVYDLAADSIMFTEYFEPGRGDLEVSPDGRRVVYTYPDWWITYCFGADASFTVFNTMTQTTQQVHVVIDAFPWGESELALGSIEITPDARWLVGIDPHKGVVVAMSMSTLMPQRYVVFGYQSQLVGPTCQKEP